ncbi:MAG: lycopene cyclase domain-containing protein [Bacteroidota bacterium]|nr:lycopene cyclase domain-containing protein [Bacteroidota bacterium]
MTTYLLINILIVVIPLALSYETKVKFYKKFTNVAFAVFTVGGMLIIWDMIAVRRGDWSFNKNYLINMNVLDLPIEEIFFFITVPFSVLFIYESLKYYLADKIYNVNKIIILITACSFFILAIIYIDKNYTATVFIVCGILLISIFFMQFLIISKIFLLTLLISVIPFLIINYFLTSLPVVVYNPEAILGIRILTIPVEDFFYSFSMITGWLLAYKLSERYIVELKTCN